MYFTVGTTLISHPNVVVHFGQVLATTVAGESHYSLRRFLFPTIVEGRGKQCPRRRASENNFLAQELPSCVKAFSVGNRIGSPDARKVRNLRQEIFADTLYQP